MRPLTWLWLSTRFAFDNDVGVDCDNGECTGVAAALLRFDVVGVRCLLVLMATAISGLVTAGAIKRFLQRFCAVA